MIGNQLIQLIIIDTLMTDAILPNICRLLLYLLQYTCTRCHV